MDHAGRLGTGALLLLPGALTVYLSFNTGGFFPNTQAFVALVLAGVLMLRIALAEAPFEGFGPGFAVAAGALALYAAWTLASALWSDSEARALLELNRALVYLLAFVLFGSVARTAKRFRVALWGLAAGITIVSVSGLVTRVLPDVWEISETIAENRLSYPLTYWNALGLLAAVGVVLCLHLASSRSEPRVARVLGAGAVPLLASAVLFTFSRGAIVAGAVGVLAYVVVGRPRALISGLVSTVPAAIVAVVAAYDADLLASPNPTSAAAIDQGHEAAVTIALCAGAAMLVRALALLLDRRLPHVRLPAASRRRVLLAAGPAALAAIVVTALAAGVPGYVERQYDRFVEGGGAGEAGDLRTRLTDPSNNGRIDEWDVALEAFARAPLEGEGAGTYENVWARDRPIVLFVRDAHSLYVEVLGELGLVGLGLLGITLVMVVVALAARTRGRSRPLYAAALAAVLTWMLRAAVDWDWEMPAVTLWLFALGGFALARTPGERAIGSLAGPLRVVAVVAAFGIAILPGLVYVSEGRLEESAQAFERGDCDRAAKEARESSDVLGSRPEPYELLAYCYLRGGAEEEAVRALEQAVERDPDAWTYRYELALARGAAGLDPRPQARVALRLNPLDVQAQEAARQLRTRDRRRWRRQALALLRGASPFYLSRR